MKPAESRIPKEERRKMMMTMTTAIIAMLSPSSADFVTDNYHGTQPSVHPDHVRKVNNADTSSSSASSSRLSPAAAAAADTYITRSRCACVTLQLRYLRLQTGVNELISSH